MALSTNLRFPMMAVAKIKGFHNVGHKDSFMVIMAKASMGLRHTHRKLLGGLR
mgnify:CR=1 FL=1